MVLRNRNSFVRVSAREGSRPPPEGFREARSEFRDIGGEFRDAGGEFCRKVRGLSTRPVRTII